MSRSRRARQSFFVYKVCISPRVADSFCEDRPTVVLHSLATALLGRTRPESNPSWLRGPCDGPAISRSPALGTCTRSRIAAKAQRTQVLRSCAIAPYVLSALPLVSVSAMLCVLTSVSEILQCRPWKPPRRIG